MLVPSPRVPIPFPGNGEQQGRSATRHADILTDDGSGSMKCVQLSWVPAFSKSKMGATPPVARKGPHHPPALTGERHPVVLARLVLLVAGKRAREQARPAMASNLDLSR